MTAGTVNAIEVENLTRTYRDVVAVDGVDLVIPRGELFGLVGPDGPAALWPQLAAMAVFSVVIFGFALLRFQKKFSD